MRKVWFRVVYLVGGAWTDGLRVVSGRMVRRMPAGECLVPFLPDLWLT